MTAEEFAKIVAYGFELAINKSSFNTSISEMPKHLYIPKGAEQVDLRKLLKVPALTTVAINLWDYKTKESQFVNFINYAIFSDSAFADDVDFFPTINGKRILRLHGDPTDNFRLNLSTGTSLDDTSLISCYERLRPFDKVEWKIKNKSSVSVRMGVRMKGYLTNQFLE